MLWETELDKSPALHIWARSEFITTNDLLYSMRLDSTHDIEVMSWVLNRQTTPEKQAG